MQYIWSVWRGWYGHTGFVCQPGRYEERLVVIPAYGREAVGGTDHMQEVGFSLAGTKVKFVLVWVVRAHGLVRCYWAAPAQNCGTHRGSNRVLCWTQMTAEAS